MTNAERTLLLRALQAYKGKIEPTSPEWDMVKKLRDDILAGRL